MKNLWKTNFIIFLWSHRFSGVIGGGSHTEILVNTMSLGRKLGLISYLSLWFGNCERITLFSLWCRSKVICGHWGSNIENLVNTISEDRKLG